MASSTFPSGSPPCPVPRQSDPRRAMARACVAAGALLGAAGCGGKILSESFDHYGAGQMPSGAIPGSPGDDHIDFYVSELSGQGKPIQNVATIPPSFGPWTAGNALGFWPYQVPTQGNGTVRLTSRTVAGGTAEKLLVWWHGKMLDPDAGFECDLLITSGQPGSLQKIASVLIDGATVKASDPAPYLQSLGSIAVGANAPWHRVTLDFRPAQNVYALEVWQQGSDIIFFQGATPTGAGALAQSASTRLDLQCRQTGTGPASAPTYLMDYVQMRARS